MVKQKCINYAIRKLDDYRIDYDYTFIHKDKKIVFNLFTGQKNIVKKYDKKLNDYEYEIFHGIIFNLGKSPNKYSYSKVFYEFAYSIYTTSRVAYRILRSVLPFPAESSLRYHFSPIVNAIEKRLTSLDRIE